ncbi:MAG TPA: hypothetical protein VFS62_12565, partial [Chloroflexota bacterium]|nr:hypothetical protein [Chloroflexota bacterium]
MFRLWPVGLVLCLLLSSLSASSVVADNQSTGPFTWSFGGNDTQGFHSGPSNGATNAISVVAPNQFPYPAGGGLRVDFTGSRGFNTSLSTSSLPQAAWDG